MSQPANMAAANQGAPFSRFLAFATPLVHQFTPYFSWTQMKVDLLKNDLRSLAFYTDLRGHMLRKIITIRKDNAAADSAIIW